MPLRFTEFFYWVFYFARSLSLSLSPLLSLSILNVTEFYRVSSLFFWRGDILMTWITEFSVISWFYLVFLT